jgi:hypothetical protein
MKNSLKNLFQPTGLDFSPVIKAAKKEFAPIDLSAGNARFTKEIYTETGPFCNYINSYLQQQQVQFAYGGYNEVRDLYLRSAVFNAAAGKEKPRNLHIGVDVWGEAGTAFFMPFPGFLHSCGFHNELGNYGTTLIMGHELEGQKFYTLYGHCAKKDLELHKPKKKINKGSLIGHFGNREENGNWPPHLHLQLIIDLQGFKGDYPGVCTTEEKIYYLNNCPDATFLIV